MKPPDLAKLEDACVRAWSGPTDALKAAAAAAHLRYRVVDLAKARDRATLFAELDRALELPDHFGKNFDALADVLEDRDWLGKAGMVIVMQHSAEYRSSHPHEWSTLQELLDEACEFWKERMVPFWVFVA
jgi:RNAse (barnase) inhibitor barstar